MWLGCANREQYSEHVKVRRLPSGNQTFFAASANRILRLSVSLPMKFSVSLLVSLPMSLATSLSVSLSVRVVWASDIEI